MTAARRATGALALLTLAVLIAGAIAVAIAGNPSDQVYVGVTALIAVATATLAIFVARQQPANRVAVLLSWMALLVVLLAFSDTYLPAMTRRPDLLPRLPGLVAAVLAVTWVWLYVAVALLMLVFPNGKLPGRRWRTVAIALPTVAVAIQVVMDMTPGPYDAPYQAVRHPFGDLPHGLSVGLKAVLFPALIGLVLACAVSLRVRYRRGNDVQRTQLKWFGLAAIAMPGTVLLSWIGFLLLGTHNLTAIGFAVMYAAVPIGTAIAILRHNLYDVDRAISAAVTYGVITAALLAVFAVAAFGTGLVFARGSAIAAASVTAATAAILAPAKRRLQRAVDRHMYPLRRAAMQATDDLRGAIVGGESGPEQLENVLRVALRDPTLRVGVNVPNGIGLLTLQGEPLDLPATATPVLVEGQQIGAISSTGPAGGPLLREVAEASAMVVEMVRLRLELSGALRDVASSRSRLLRSGYDERRRFERDLHDGAQQRLVSLGMALRLAQRHLGDRSVDIDGLLDESVAQLSTAVAELREIAHGLRPSCLDEGLHPALSAIAASATLPVDLSIEADRAIPEDVATTIFYVVSEAVANAVKHAEANRIGLRVVQEADQLHVRIEDDGRGGAAARPGSGLSGLSDRVAAAGGSLLVHSAPSEGTVVEVMLPCAS